MNKVMLYSGLLVLGLVGSQFLPILFGDFWPGLAVGVRIATMVTLSFIMIHVGYEFELFGSKPKEVAFDYLIAATAAAFPWIFVALYFVLVLGADGAWNDLDSWKHSLLAGRFAAPTSAGVLFSMLAAAGLSATWMFRKARVLAIFDDLDTVLLMIPLKMLIVGVRWQMAAIVGIMSVQLFLAWKMFRKLRWSVSWRAVLGYSGVIVVVSEILYQTSKLVDDVVPVHVEVLLPAFVLGCMLAKPQKKSRPAPLTEEAHGVAHSAADERASTIVSAVFMVLVGLSMPELAAVLTEDGPDATTIALHVLAVTALANLGKMFPVLVYRREASFRERLALTIGMWPRGEVGAGVLILSLSYGITGPMIVVATLSLALNLVFTGVFISIVRRLLRPVYTGTNGSI